MAFSDLDKVLGSNRILSMAGDLLNEENQKTLGLLKVEDLKDVKSVGDELQGIGGAATRK
ncbi:hypothetical protein QJS10_CPA03g00667 [Acorus calamus]|uniref:Uncharacterized protein n=1 Tax=Acorus calamus TaxID=4465 RepID=A0AAV9F6Z4_ACOCL|nr:hypothetical protein QJS10_CPA03g00667 [Acorus calamus]